MHPQRISYRTVNEKMVHRFYRTAAHPAPIRQREAPKHQIIQGKSPTMGCSPQEESHPLRHLDFPNPLPWEARRRCTLIIEGPSIKLTIPIKAPMGSITPIPLRIRAWMRSRNKKAASNSLSWKFLKNLTFQHLLLPSSWWSNKSEIQASLSLEHVYN